VPIEKYNAISIYDALRRQAGDFSPEWLEALIANTIRRLQKSINLDVESVERSIFTREYLRPSLDVLRTDGFCFLPPVSSDRLREANNELRQVLYYDSDDYFAGGLNSGERYSREQVPSTLRIAAVAPEDYEKIPSFIRMANDPYAVSIVANYLGAVPTISYVSSWISRPSDNALNAQLFHIDRHDFKFLKLFVYLTDVTPSTGPHTFVRGSHNSDRIREKIMQIVDHNKKTEVIKALSQVRLSDDFIFGLFGVTDVVNITGPASTQFLADTSGFHRGLVPRVGDRELFQAAYVLAQNPKDPVQKIKFNSFLDHYRTWYPDSPFGDSEILYMNRVLIDSGQA